MPDFLTSPFENSVVVSPVDVSIRLLAAFVLGCVVAWIYRRTRKSSEIVTSFPITLVLLSILIAMVTQVIGDNIARAFSLVGALSIVRFRTVVRDTQDTAYVIFAVVVGMAVGARYPWVALIGIGVVGLAAFLLMTRTGFRGSVEPLYELNMRVGIGHDLEQLFGPLLDSHLVGRELQSIGTAKQGAALEVAYRGRMHANGSTTELVQALNRIEGVQNVQLERRPSDEE